MAAEPALTARGAYPEDRAIVAALRAGDERAFRALFDRYQQVMRRAARGYVDSDAVAEEIVQETWLAIVRGIDRFEGRSALLTWMFAILFKQAHNHHARERRTLPLSSLGREEDDDLGCNPDRFQNDDEAWPGHWATPPRPWQKPERRLLSLEAREHLKAALAQLPERQRTVIALRDVDGLPADEVCAMLGLSPENQRVLLHRGRSRLRAELEAYVDQAGL